MLALLGPLPEIAAAASYDIGIVVAGRLNVRAEPEIGSASLAVLSKGTKVRILENVDGWLKIAHQGHEGYIRNREHYVRVARLDVAEDAQTSKAAGTDIEKAIKEAENISQKIKEGQAKVQTFIQKESAVINSLNSIDLALNASRKRTAELKVELPELEARIDETARESRELTRRIEDDQAYVAQRLVSLYKLNWLGRLNILASADTIYDLFQRQKTLELVLAHDRVVMETLLKNKLERQMLLTRLNAQKSEKLRLEGDLEAQIQIMIEKKSQRAGILKDIRSKKSLELAALESLKLSAKELDQVIRSLSKRAAPPEKPKKMSPKRFTSLKGLLNMPVKGKIISFFGPYKNPEFNVTNFRSGIVIEADRGEPIRAVHDGSVLFASWFKGYGNIIIIDHGENYYTVYAHAEELFASKGDRVEKGEVVATVGDTGSFSGPALHFEVRHFGKPVDPLKWIKKG